MILSTLAESRCDPQVRPVVVVVLTVDVVLLLLLLLLAVEILIVFTRLRVRSARFHEKLLTFIALPFSGSTMSGGRPLSGGGRSGSRGDVNLSTSPNPSQFQSYQQVCDDIFRKDQ